MQLINMTQADYDFWAPRSQKDYALEKQRSNNLTREEAEEIARKDFERYLPQGLESKNNYLYTLKNEQQERVGFIWFVARGPEDNRKAFLLDIVIEEQQRGRGYGKKAMLLLEQKVKELKLGEIGLHVFGNNAPAIGLYKSLGYQITDMVMAKSLQ